MCLLHFYAECEYLRTSMVTLKLSFVHDKIPRIYLATMTIKYDCHTFQFFEINFDKLLPRILYKHIHLFFNGGWPRPQLQDVSMKNNRLR